MAPTASSGQIPGLHPAGEHGMRFNPTPGHLHLTARTGRIKLIEPAGRIVGG
jgi:hypothetical protein